MSKPLNEFGLLIRCQYVLDEMGRDKRCASQHVIDRCDIEFKLLDFFADIH